MQGTQQIKRNKRAKKQKPRRRGRERGGETAEIVDGWAFVVSDDFQTIYPSAGITRYGAGTYIYIRHTRFPTIKGSGDSSDGRSGALMHIMDGATYFRAGMGRRQERERVGVVVAEVTQGTDQQLRPRLWAGSQVKAALRYARGCPYTLVSTYVLYMYNRIKTDEA